MALCRGRRGADAGDGSPAQAELIAPPRAVLEELLELARLGMLMRVEQIALELEQARSALSPFRAPHLRAWRATSRKSALVALLQRLPGSPARCHRRLSCAGARLLIVDDKPQNLRLISDFLAEQGFELMLTRSGAQALEKIAAGHARSGAARCARCRTWTASRCAAA